MAASEGPRFGTLSYYSLTMGMMSFTPCGIIKHKYDSGKGTCFTLGLSLFTMSRKSQKRSEKSQKVQKITET